MQPGLEFDYSIALLYKVQLPNEHAKGLEQEFPAMTAFLNKDVHKIKFFLRPHIMTSMSNHDPIFSNPDLPLLGRSNPLVFLNVLEALFNL